MRRAALVAVALLALAAFVPGDAGAVVRSTDSTPIAAVVYNVGGSLFVNWSLMSLSGETGTGNFSAATTPTYGVYAFGVNSSGAWRVFPSGATSAVDDGWGTTVANYNLSLPGERFRGVGACFHASGALTLINVEECSWVPATDLYGTPDDDSAYVTNDYANASFAHVGAVGNLSGVRIGYFEKMTAHLGIFWDSNSSPGADVVTVIGGNVQTWPEADGSAWNQLPPNSYGDCAEPIYIEVYPQDPVTLAQGNHQSLWLNCDWEIGEEDVPQFDSVTARSVNGSVYVNWSMGADDSTATGGFEVSGNASTGLPERFGSIYDWQYTPDYYICGTTPLCDPRARSLVVPASGFPNGTTFLRVDYFLNMTSTTSTGPVSHSCEVAFVADGAAHSCAADDDSTYEGSAHANATWCPLPCSGGGNGTVTAGVQHVPVLFNPHGALVPAIFDESVTTLLNSPTPPDGSPDQLGQLAPCCGGEVAAALFMTGNASGTPAFADPATATEPREWHAPRAGNLTSLRVEAYGPVSPVAGCEVSGPDCFVNLTVFGQHGNLTVHVLRNGVQVATQRWSTGEVGYKEVISTPVALVAGDAVELRMSHDGDCEPCGSPVYAGMWGYVAGVEWENATSSGGGSGTGGNTTVNVAGLDFTPAMKVAPYVLIVLLVLACLVVARIADLPWFTVFGAVFAAGGYFLLAAQGEGAQAAPFFRWGFLGLGVVCIVGGLVMARDR